MPRGDRIWARSSGFRSGRGMGYCAGNGLPAWQDARIGSGMGAGRGWRHWLNATSLAGWLRRGREPRYDLAANPDLERELLNTQACMLQAQLDVIKRRLNELDPAGRE